MANVMGVKFTVMTVLKAQFADESVIKDKLLAREEISRFFYFNSANDRNVFYSLDELVNGKTRTMQMLQNVNMYIEIRDKKVINRRVKTIEIDNKKVVKEILESRATVDIVLFVFNPQNKINNDAFKCEVSDSVIYKKDYFNFVNHCVKNFLHMGGGEIVNDYYNNVPYQQSIYKMEISLEDVVEEHVDEVGFYLDKIKTSSN